MINTEINNEQSAEVTFTKTIQHLKLANISYEVKSEQDSTLIIIKLEESAAGD